jgi:TrkA domain protein
VCAVAASDRAGDGLLIDALAPAHHSPNVLSTIDLGLVAERIELSAASHWNGRVLGDTRMRAETGASLVATTRPPTCG